MIDGWTADNLISREYLKKFAIPCDIHNGALTDLCVPLYQIDNAPTVSPKLSDEQIEKITDLLETEWGYEGIREDVSRILRGEEE